MQYHHILIAIDLAPNSQQVIKGAVELAKGSHASLNIVHVIEHSPIAYGGEFSIPIDVNLEQTIETEAKKSLKAFCQPFSIPENKQYVLTGAVKHTVIT